ncbi:MAG: hypothetical protein GY751_20085, partial [Bacteroidetes bacterium]|nr:hypothetical protein [Bacteroidota bacterium]
LVDFAIEFAGFLVQALALVLEQGVLIGVAVAEDFEGLLDIGYWGLDIGYWVLGIENTDKPTHLV